MSRKNKLKLLVYVIAALVGFFQLVAKYKLMDPDGVSYLDISDAYRHGDWHNAINAYWSPLFSWLLALTLTVIKPSTYWEFSSVHFVNYIVFLIGLPCFSFFLSELATFRSRLPLFSAQRAEDFLPAWLWWVLGYALFIWSSVELIGITRPTPDMCAGIIVYLAAGLTLRLRSSQA
ncbi:MAG: hypothetical protein ACRD4L_02995, partial [Pyrinomonadaceae bacterium]